MVIIQISTNGSVTLMSYSLPDSDKKNSFLKIRLQINRRSGKELFLLGRCRSNGFLYDSELQLLPQAQVFRSSQVDRILFFGQP